jgi:dCTP deaminase
MLSDQDIKRVLDRREIMVSGAPYIGPASVDFHLDNKCKVLKMDAEGILMCDGTNDDKFENLDDWNDLIVYPDEFYILSTKEKITLDNNHAGFVYGRSSLARIGLNIHMAGFVDPGFSGNITLEVTNFTRLPIKLNHGMRIGQMVFIRTDSPCLVPYSRKADAKYQGQSGPTLSKIQKDYGNKAC